MFNLRYVILLIVFFSINELCLKAEEISLNGKWEIVFDEENVGEEEKWFLDENFPTLKVSNIDVPSSWEFYRKNYEGVAWYRKKFEVPKKHEGQKIIIRFDAANYIAEVYLNNEAIGYHEGGYDPFEFTIDDLINYDDSNTLIVRITSPIVTKHNLKVDGLTYDEAPHWRGALTAGVWQDVKLKIKNNIYTQNVFIEPFIEGKVFLNTEINNCYANNRTINIEYFIKEFDTEKVVWKKEEKRTLNPGRNDFKIEAKINEPKLWSPDNPNLYQLELKINSGESFTERFGIREITLKEDGFYLNEEKFYLKGAFWEGVYPLGLTMPDSPEMVEKEIKLAKQAGFNLLRFWRKPPVPYILDMADELGIAIISAPAFESMNLKPKPVPQMPNRVFHEISSMIKRDRNHPSIIMWELFNEIKMNELKRIMNDASLLARSLDPTRIIIDESGGWAGVPRAYPPYNFEGVVINEYHRYLKAPVTQEIYNDFLHIAHLDYDKKYRLSEGFKNEITPNAVTIVSEIGYGSFPNLESNYKKFKDIGNPITATYYAHEKLHDGVDSVFYLSGLNNVFDSIEELFLESQRIQAEGNKEQFEAVRLNNKVHGYCLHAYTGGDWVYGAGILDIWRNPKEAYYTMKQVNQPLYISARIEPSNVYAGDSIEIKVSAVNEYENRKGKIIIQIDSESKEKLFYDEFVTNLTSGVHGLYHKKIALSEITSGKHKLRVAYREEGKTITSNNFDFNIFQKGQPIFSEKIVVIDPDNKIKRFLTENNISYIESLPENEESLLIITTCNDLNTEEEFVLFSNIFKKVHNGSKVIFLNPPVKSGNFDIITGDINVINSPNNFYKQNILPFELIVRNAKGRWIPVNHGVTKHPYFSGLPVGGFMDSFYKNVCAENTLIHPNEKGIVPTISWDVKRDYWGIRNVWSGSDLSRLKYGKGFCIISLLNLIDNLDKDPVADKILMNIINYEIN